MPEIENISNYWQLIAMFITITLFLLSVILMIGKKYINDLKLSVDNNHSAIMMKLSDLNEEIGDIKLQMVADRSHLQGVELATQERFSNIEAGDKHTNERLTTICDRIAKTEKLLAKFTIYHRQNHPGDRLD